jgi:alkylation response protein AidB-like acyl-CoA dehydrogenase
MARADLDLCVPAYAETATARYLNARAASIFGGSEEVQKNIIARAVLGL